MKAWAVAFILAGAAPARGAEPLDAKALIRKVETQYQAKTSHAVAVMTVKTPSWTRDIKLEMWSQGREKFLAKILEPKKDAGTQTLKIDDEMWNYLPKIDRLMKIPASLMGDKWMGSNLTNDDLVREVKIDELYDFTVLAADDKAAEIAATPKKGAAVVWGKVVYQVDLEKTVPIDVKYYDEDGELVRTILFSDVDKINGQWVARLMTVQPADSPGESTLLHYDKLELNSPLSDGMFSVRNLRRH